TPSTQSRTSGTSVSSSNDSRLATGASENSSLHSPSTGRPRCAVPITAAPCPSACLSVGSEANMRGSEVVRPLSSCTFSACVRCHRVSLCLVVWYAAVVERHVRFLPDQHALAGQVEVGHSQDCHLLFCSRSGVSATRRPLVFRGHQARDSRHKPRIVRLLRRS